MANRSDRNSKLPRQYKRMISSMVAAGSIPANHERTVRKMFIEAHAHALEVDRKRSKMLTNVDREGEDLDEATPAVAA